MKEHKDYVVIVALGEEAIHLSAESEEQAIIGAKNTIAEQYGYDLSRSSTVTYTVLEKWNN